MYEQWEYISEFVYAHIENQGVKEYLTKKYPKWKNIPTYTPETMELHLNQMGANGWELVHMQPVPLVGKNADVPFFYGGSGGGGWSNIYFCVFKRRTEKSTER